MPLKGSLIGEMVSKPWDDSVMEYFATDFLRILYKEFG